MPIQAVRTGRPANSATPAGTYQAPVRGSLSAPILVVCDPPKVAAFRAGLPMDEESLRLLATLAKQHGLGREDFCFVGLCPPMPEDALDSAKRKWAHVEAHVEALHSIISRSEARCIVSLGELASRAVLGRGVAITKARGMAVEKDNRLVLPMLSPAYVNRIPEHRPTFEADIATLATLRANDFQLSAIGKTEVQYEWREDISDLLTNPPAMVALDTETTGLVWHDPAVQVLTVQLTWQEGQGIAIAIDPDYGNWRHRMRARARLLAQLKAVLEDPQVRKCGANIKFDHLMLRKLGIEVQGWQDDTQLMAFAVDENMMSKALDDCVRRWVPAMVGYSDNFDATVDKSNMRAVPLNDEYDEHGNVVRLGMLNYAAGDTDATFRLRNVLDEMLRQDPKQYNCYRRLMIPGILAFANYVERFGMLIDQQRLREFGVEVSQWLQQEYRELIQLVPAAVRRKHLEAGKELKFSRSEFVKDTLFTRDGFNLTPVVFTKTTARLEEDQREPSTSTKDHLPFFTDRDDAAGEFVRRLIDYQKTEKLLGTYIGDEERGNGLWQYIAPDGRIYPSYMLHKTVTGRSASAAPNGQNFPKRGRWAKPYQRIFKATPGYKLVNVDLSQIELRLAAWMATEPTMLRIYREDGDIHTATAKITSGLTDEQWAALPHKEKKALRTKAKAINFGFIYGMREKKFRAYAKTDYGVDYTEAEAKQARERFFNTYRRLEPWHEAMRAFVHKHGYVRALHGARRNLPSIRSNDDAIKAGAERQAINSPVQRFGSDLGVMAVIRFSLQADPTLFRIIGFVHDAIVMEVRDGHEQEGIEALLWCMENAPLQEWFGITAPLPIRAEAEIGMDGGSLLEFSELPPVEERPEWFTAMGFDTVTATKPEWWDDEKERQAMAAFVHWQ